MLMMFLLICGVYYLMYRAIIKIIREIKKKVTFVQNSSAHNPLSTCTQVMSWKANNSSPNPPSTSS